MADERGVADGFISDVITALICEMTVPRLVETFIVAVSVTLALIALILLRHHQRCALRSVTYLGKPKPCKTLEDVERERARRHSLAVALWNLSRLPRRKE